jgi:hypothetical protein
MMPCFRIDRQRSGCVALAVCGRIKVPNKARTMAMRILMACKVPRGGDVAQDRYHYRGLCVPGVFDSASTAATKFSHNH